MLIEVRYDFYISVSVLSFLPIHYHLQVEANPKKNCTKKPMLFLVSMGKTGLSHDIFFEFSLRPFEVIEVAWKSRLHFWGCDLQHCKKDPFFLNYTRMKCCEPHDLGECIIYLQLTIINQIFHIGRGLS